jgi:hypothetical protein
MYLIKLHRKITVFRFLFVAQFSQHKKYKFALLHYISGYLTVIFFKIILFKI